MLLLGRREFTKEFKMPLPVYVVASNMLGQTTKLDMIADNVANANTNGYKKQSMDFAEVLSKKQSQEVASFNHHIGTSTDYTVGSLTRTNSDFDIAIQDNDGFFAVEGAGGAPLYTRNGHFTKDSNGNMVDSQGRPLLDTNGAPITIPADSEFVHITPNGGVSDQNGVIANVGVFNFQNNQLLQRAGKNAWAAPAQAGVAPVELPNVKQGFLEGSNVNPIEETTQMTKMLRNYQMAAKLMGNMEDLENRAIQNLSRMP